MTRTWTYLEILDALSAAQSKVGGLTARDCSLTVAFKEALEQMLRTKPKRKGKLCRRKKQS